MKKMKKKLINILKVNKMKTGIFLIKSFCVILLAGMICGCTRYPEKEVTNQPFVNKKVLNMYVGDEVQITASPSDAAFHWSSDNEEVASVSQSGVVTAIGEGLATISVASENDKTNVDVRVKTFVPLADINLSVTSVQLAPGGKVQLWAYPVPENASEFACTWTSANPAVATVDKDGLVTALVKGIAIVTVTVGDVTKTIEVRIPELYQCNKTGWEVLFAPDADQDTDNKNLIDDNAGTGAIAGDIKYKDINGDYVIDRNDKVPIGFPFTPEINYGFGLSVGYKNVDFSCFFSGSARSSFWIDAQATSPFINDVKGATGSRAMLQYWADSYWNESTRDINALWPRLSPNHISNNGYGAGQSDGSSENELLNTWFMRDGNFVRLKSMELGYTLPKKWVNTIKMQNIRLYASGSNLFVLSKFKMWDPEQGSNGLAYPLQRVINIGVNIEF
jgi:hypothetical protein